jgi:rhodanese-related sulfurtransferase
MKKSIAPLLILAALAIAFLRPVLAAPKIAPAEALEKVRTGGAVLIDVREPAEWRGGVVEGARLLPLSDLRGPRALWDKTLADSKGRELVLYCRSGNRSGQAAAILENEGWTVWNAGGFSAWAKAGLPVSSPTP